MAVQGRGACPQCQAPDQLLYNLEPTDPAEGLACPECVRKRARVTHRTTPCDKCGALGAWRNPYTRRNEYLCPTHHAESGDGVVLNRWAPRVSHPHPAGRRVSCSVSDNSCRGEVKPSGPGGQLLCRRHAGKTSAAWDIIDSDTYKNMK
jgi:hypothetical protein